MYLMRLELRGFKSFVEAQVVFQPGITAVVGPNGVGKSNILDAVLWVLGEQSTKALRSERMEDVIFNGTETRQPLGMAEVSLVLGDVDGASHGNGNGDGEGAPLPFALGECQEAMVTRRLFRDGVSSPSSSAITGRFSTSARKPIGTWASLPCVKALRPPRSHVLRTRCRPTSSAWQRGRRR